jgi:hypothetical protein
VTEQHGAAQPRESAEKFTESGPPVENVFLPPCPEHYLQCKQIRMLVECTVGYQYLPQRDKVIQWTFSIRVGCFGARVVLGSC